MKLINRFADRVLNRLAPESQAEAGSPPCPEYECSTTCWRMCCPGKPCSPCYCL